MDPQWAISKIDQFLQVTSLVGRSGPGISYFGTVMRGPGTGPLSERTSSRSSWTGQVKGTRIISRSSGPRKRSLGRASAKSSPEAVTCSFAGP